LIDVIWSSARSSDLVARIFRVHAQLNGKSFDVQELVRVDEDPPRPASPPRRRFSERLALPLVGALVVEAIALPPPS
jgi:hypothetical protein